MATAATLKDNTARFALAKLEELHKCLMEQSDLSRRLEELRPRIEALRGQAGQAVHVLHNLKEAGYLPPKEWEVVNFAWEQYRATVEGRAPLEPRTLTDVVAEISTWMDGEFRAEAIYDHVQQYLPVLKQPPHRASITSALNHLVTLGRLRKTSEGGRGKAATYIRKEDLAALRVERFLREQDDTSTPKD